MNLIDRVKNIIVTPAKEWDVISTESPNTGAIIMGYVLPLAGAAALMSFLGQLIFGWWGIKWAFTSAIISVIFAVISVLVSAAINDALAPSFGSEKNFGKSLQLISYSYTPAWVGGLLAILPILGSIGAIVGAIYGLYILYLGLPKMKKTPADKQVSYLVVQILVNIVIYAVLYYVLLTTLLRSFGFYYPRVRIDY